MSASLARRPAVTDQDLHPLTGRVYLSGLVRHLAENLGVTAALLAERTDPDSDRARTLAVYASGQLLPDAPYGLRDMPCGRVAELGAVHLPSGVAQRFPASRILLGTTVESYLGLLLPGLGSAWIAVLDRAPLIEGAECLALLRRHARRAASELERLRLEVGQRSALERLDAELAARTAELAALREGLEREIGNRRRTETALCLSEDKFQKAFRANPGAVSISTAPEGRLLDVNETYLRLTGYTREEVIGRTGLELGLWVDPTERERLARILHVEGSLRGREFSIRRRSGELATLLISAELVQMGSRTCILTAGIDITERKRAEAALKASEERYALAARGANDGLFDWELAKNEIYFSPRWREMLGQPEDEAGRSPREWLSRVHAEDRDRLGMDIVAHLEGLTPHFQNEHRVSHSDGGWRWVLCRGLAVRDEFGAAYRFAGSQTEITERKLAEERLLHDAFHDSLTGLPNRALFMDRLGQALERGKRHLERVCAVLFLDLDRFKLVNDSLGHSMGDQLLFGISRRLQQSARPEDTVARLGGDEFAVLLDGVSDVSDATRVASRIGEALCQPFDLGGQEVFSSASIGIAVSSSAYGRPEDMLRDADTALYRAKARGRTRYEVFDPTMHQRAVAELQLETDLRRALAREELAVSYQPIVRLADGRLAGFEALARWHHAGRGMVPPAEFIELAEETGLIVTLGNTILRKACRQAREWLDRYGDEHVRPVCVNLSTRQFAQPDHTEGIREILAETGLPGRLLTLEITESLLMENPDAAAAMLTQLKELEVRVSVDDFGTGYSCLSLLHQLPIDTLKIDRSFVARMGARGSGDETVRTIIALAHGLGMSVVAEGVETAEQLATLRTLDCGYGQGFLFAEPLQPPAAEPFIASGRVWTAGE